MLIIDQGTFVSKSCCHFDAVIYKFLCGKRECIEESTTSSSIVSVVSLPAKSCDITTSEHR